MRTEDIQNNLHRNNVEDWKINKVKDCCHIVKKSFKPSLDDVRKYIGLEHIEQQTLRLVTISSTENIQSNKFKFEVGQILFGKLRPYFRKIYRPKFDGVCSTDIWVIDTHGQNDQVFFFYFFADARIVKEANNSSMGTRMPRASWDYLKELEFLIPPLAEQQSIAKILSNLDSKIELNQKMSKTLEKIAQTIFKSWFVDYEFPDENGRPYRSSGGEMMYSEELGKEIPKGWDVSTMKSDFDIVMGQSPPGKSYNKNGKGVIFFQGRTDFNQRFPSIRMYCTEPKRFAKVDDTLISVRAPVGDINLTFEDCCIGRGLAALRHKSGNSSYTYYFMQSLESIFDSYEAGGTVFGSINKKTFEEIMIMSPPIHILDSFKRIVLSMDEQIKKNTLESMVLFKIRDLLLPKLMSGKIRVPY